MKALRIIGALIVLLAVGSVLGCAEEEPKEAAGIVQTDEATTSDDSEPTTEATTSDDSEPKETVAQENARRSAESYLDSSGFSRSGLIGQLEYEGFSKKDATYAVNKVGANWKQEAVESAEGYLDSSGFSRSGLIDQLEYEGFTPAQATYAVNKVGL